MDTRPPGLAPALGGRRCRGWVVHAVTLLAGLSMLMAGGVHRGRAQEAGEEYRIKAAFIFHFAQLVDWPADMPADAENSFFLCTLGEDPFHGLLESAVAGKSIGQRVIRTRHLAQAQETQSCQILFLGKAQSPRIAALVANLRQAPVLTIGETEGFVTAGGMIGFLLRDNKVRFEINVAAAESARLKIGSRLLLLAQTVVRDTPGK